MLYSKQLLVRGLVTILILGLSSAPLLAQASRQSQDVDIKVDYALARQEMLNFETVLSGVIASTFSSSPFALVQKPKGVYLAGYGVTFNFLINIHRAVVDTPFGQIKNKNITPELKRRVIEDLKEKLIRTLLDNGENLRQLRKEDAVAIVAFMEDRNFPDEPNENKTIILSVLKKDFDDVARTDDKWKEFKQRMKIIEY